jgi:hypothetical protein
VPAARAEAPASESVPAVSVSLAAEHCLEHTDETGAISRL